MQEFSLCCLPLNMATPWLREKSMHIHLHLHMHLHKSRHIYDLNERQLILIFLFPSLLFFNPLVFLLLKIHFPPLLCPPVWLSSETSSALLVGFVCGEAHGGWKCSFYMGAGGRWEPRWVSWLHPGTADLWLPSTRCFTDGCEYIMDEAFMFC